MYHHPRGGSKADTDINCALAFNMRQKMPARPSSSHAELGSAKHDCMEEILLDGRTPQYFLGRTVNGIEVDQDFVDDLADALEAWERFCANHDIKEFEPEVHCIKDEDTGGHADIVAASPVRVWILDWKFGKGIQVFPEENAQGAFYAMCGRINSTALDLFKGKEKFGFAVVQPNDRGLDVLRTWEFDLQELEAFQRKYEDAVAASLEPDPQPTPGEHCRWCPGAAVCDGLQRKARAALKMDPESLQTLAESMDLVGQLKDWIKQVESTTFDQLRAKAKVPGWKLVLKRAVSKWKDEDAVIANFRRKMGGIKHMTTTKILTPAQMKKAAKARGVDIDFDDYILSQSSGETLAPETDSRPAVGGDGAFVGAILKKANSK